MINKAIGTYYDFWVQMNAWYDNFAKKNNITVSQLYIFMGLEESNFKITISQLINYTQVPKQTMTSILNQLEKDHIITRTEHPNDRRSKLIEPTGEGLKLITDILNQLHQVENKSFTELGLENVNHLNKLSHELLQNFETNSK